MADEIQKRHVAYKLRVGQIKAGTPRLEGERMIFVDIDGKNVSRINLIANIVDKYIQEGEKKYGNFTLDDASGQIRVKFFGDDVDKLANFNQGDTVLVVGLLRVWSEEIYITPEIIKKKDPRFLLIRKLEIDAEKPQVVDKEKIAELKDKILSMVKEKDSNGGIAIDTIILDLKENPDVINKEIKRLLEDGVVYEPRPGKLRYLG